MGVELQILGWAVLLAAVQLLLGTLSANLAGGLGFLAGPRDEPRPIPPITGRLFRAFDNHIQGLVLFGSAVMLVEFGQASTPATQAAAMIYLGARIVYLPVYGLGIAYLRSAVWAVGFGATVYIVATTLF